MTKKKRIMLYPNSHALRTLGSSSAGVVNLAVESTALAIAQAQDAFFAAQWDKVVIALADCPLPPAEAVTATVESRLERVGMTEQDLSLAEALHILLTARFYHEYKDEIPENSEWWTLEFRHKFLAERGIL